MKVDDLRFGRAPVPEAGPGYDPLGDARALVLPAAAGAAGGPLPAGASERPLPGGAAGRPLPGEQFRGSLGPGHRFVVRIPSAWNGRLVVCGTPSMRSEHANDAIYGDALLERGYAYAASNKGIPFNAVAGPRGERPDPLAYVVPFRWEGEPGTTAMTFGALAGGGVRVGAWHADLPRLVVTARELVAAARGRPPERTYALGLSIGGGQVRYLLERHPDLVDGGVECAAVRWHPDDNILTYLPAFLRHMPAYVASGYRDRTAHDAIVAAGFPPDRVQPGAPVPSLWNAHYAALPPFYADLTTFVFAHLLDERAGALDTLEARAAYVPSGAARAEIAGFAQTGDLGKPLIGIAGDADVFITPERNFFPYLAAVRAAGRSARYWPWLVAGGTHVDAYAALGWDLQAQAPYVLRALDRLAALVEHGADLPGAGTLRRVATLDAL